MEESRNLKIIMLFLCTLFLFLGIFTTYKTNDYSLLNEHNSKFFKNESFNPSLYAKKLTLENHGKQEYNIEFYKEELDHLKTGRFTMFLNKFTDNAYSVKLNDIIIASEGDMDMGRSIIKSNANYFTIDSNLIREKNKLTINTYSVYKSGLESEGVYITDSVIGNKQARKLKFYGVYLDILGIGILIASAISMFFIYIFNKREKIDVLYCAISTILLAIYMMDYIKFEYLRYDYIFYKKIYLSALHIGFWFYTLVLDSFYDCFYLKYSSGIAAFGFIFIIPFINNFVVFSNIYFFWYMFSIINILIAFIYSLINIKKSDEALIFSLLLGFLFLYLGISLFVESIDSSTKINSPLIYILVTFMLPIVIGMRELIDNEKKLYNEQAEKEENYIKSITDDLTGVFNQRFLFDKLEMLSDQVVIAMIDIDNFKLINDNYGHLVGDHILKELIGLLKGMVRSTDEIYRYGGDEFIIILHNCTEDIAEKKMNEFRKKVENHNFIYNNLKANITVSIGIYKTIENQKCGEILKKVDKKLYKSKEKGRNTVTI